PHAREGQRRSVPGDSRYRWIPVWRIEIPAQIETRGNSSHRGFEMTAGIQVVVNGETREVPAGLHVTGLLAHLGLPADRVAIERNLEILPRAQWLATPVQPGDRLEIVHMVGGGQEQGKDEKISLPFSRFKVLVPRFPVICSPAFGYALIVVWRHANVG